MGTAIVLRPPVEDGTAPGGARSWRARVAADLDAGLRDAGFEPRTVVGLDDLAAVVGSSEIAPPMVLVDARAVLGPSALRALALDPRVDAGVLVRTVPGRVPTSHRAVRVDRGVVVAASSPLHAPLTGRTISVGACVLDATRLEALQPAVDGLRAGWGADELARAFEEGPVELVVAALLAGGHRLTAVDARGMVAERVEDEASATAALERRATADHDRAWLDAAVKARDGFFTTFFVSPYTRFIARWAARAGLSPNQVTVVSMLVGVLAAASFATGGRGAAVVGAIALQVAFALDCVDGQLARYTQRFSTFGGWLDAIFDRGKEYVVYAGLAYGAARTGDSGVWALASAALALQVARHTVDFSFARHRPPPHVRSPVLAPAGTGSTRHAEGGGPATGEAGPAPVEPEGAGRVLDAAAAAEDNPVLRWGKRIVVFPIGERFAVISVTAIVASPTLTFQILLVWGAIAAAYTTTGRVLRARRW